MGRLTLVLASGLFGLAFTAVVVLAQEELPSPLVALPLVALAGALASSRRIRGLAAAAMCGWCCLAAASVGIFMAPCAAAMVWNARRSA